MKIEVEESALEAIKAMAQRLQSERAELIRVLFEKRVDALLAKCTQEQPVSDWQERMK